MGGDLCKHYNGLELFHGTTGGKCRAGVDPVFSFCGGDRFGWFKKAPCNRTNETDAICPAAEFPTPEEVEAEEREFQELFNMIINVRRRIQAQHVETGKWAGEIECPKCGKSLHWTKAQVNGHVHGHCETKGCVSWVE